MVELRIRTTWLICFVLLLTEYQTIQAFQSSCSSIIRSNNIPPSQIYDLKNDAGQQYGLREQKVHHQHLALNRRKLTSSLRSGASANAEFIPQSNLNDLSNLTSTTNHNFQSHGTHQHRDIQALPIDSSLEITSSTQVQTPDATTTQQSNKGGISERRKSNVKHVLLAIVSIFFATFSLILASGPGAWRYYLAGGICAAFSHAITTPVDVVKTRKQVDSSFHNKSFVKSAIKIAKEDANGFKALLAGLGPTVFGYLFEGALKFGVYEVLKPPIKSALKYLAQISSIAYLDSKTLGFLISGIVAGAVASVMLCPMEALRIRLVAEPEFGADGWVVSGMNMIEDEGINGLWKGLTAMLSKQVPYTVTKNVSFDLLTTFLYSSIKTSGYEICSRMMVVIPLISAMGASVLSCISSQPGDMLLSTINAKKSKLGTRDVAREIVKEHGIGHFFNGMQTRFWHVGIIVTVQLLIYDFVKRLCGIAATGL